MIDFLFRPIWEPISLHHPKKKKGGVKEVELVKILPAFFQNSLVYLFQPVNSLSPECSMVWNMSSIT